MVRSMLKTGRLVGMALMAGGLVRAAASSPPVAREEALGFDHMLVIQRQAMRPSHVYTYHNEDFRAGGGLYRWDRDGGLEKLVDSPEGQLLDLEVSYSDILGRCDRKLLVNMQ
jgi:hypothetical protein